jgi:hypothetical protein
MSGPAYGMCPCSRDWMKESSGNPLSGQDWIKAPPKAPKHLDDTDDVMRNLALKKIDAFSGIGHGFFFWNFRTDLYEPEWSYMAALERGWIPRGNLNTPAVQNACKREESSTVFKCVLKFGQIDTSIRQAVRWAFNYENLTQTPQAQQILNLTGSDLQSAANAVLTDFFDAYRFDGVTCDFGGVALLIERNTTLVDNADMFLNDDEYFKVYVDKGPNWVVLIMSGIGIALVGGLAGFVLAMRSNEEFNRRVRESSAFGPIARRGSKAMLSALNLPDMNYEELENMLGHEEKVKF